MTQQRAVTLHVTHRANDQDQNLDRDPGLTMQGEFQPGIWGLVNFLSWVHGKAIFKSLNAGEGLTTPRIHLEILDQDQGLGLHLGR